MASFGRWKKDFRKRARFIQRALMHTDATQTRIAERAGIKRSATVSLINTRERIRPRELTKAIRARIMSDILGGTKKAWRAKKKVRHFSETEKQNILNNSKHKVIIAKQARKWMRSEPIKEKFGGQLKNLVDAINWFVLEHLDYYDPSVISRTGKPVMLSTWIYKGAEMYCKRIYFDAKREAGQQNSLIKTDIEVGKTAFTDRVELVRSWVPYPTKPLLRKLGLDPEKVADVGFDDVKKQIIQISLAKETGLTKRQREVTKLLIEGKTLLQIAQRFGMRSKSNIHQIEAGAAKKIKRQLEKKLRKKR